MGNSNGLCVQGHMETGLCITKILVSFRALKKHKLLKISCVLIHSSDIYLLLCSLTGFLNKIPTLHGSILRMKLHLCKLPVTERGVIPNASVYTYANKSSGQALQKLTQSWFSQLIQAMNFLYMHDIIIYDFSGNSLTSLQKKVLKYTLT